MTGNTKVPVEDIPAQVLLTIACMPTAFVSVMVMQQSHSFMC